METNIFRITCPRCQRRFAVNAAAAGRHVACPNISCGLRVHVSDREASLALWPWGVGGAVLLVVLIVVGVLTLSFGGGPSVANRQSPTPVAAVRQADSGTLGKTPATNNAQQSPAPPEPSPSRAIGAGTAAQESPPTVEPSPVQRDVISPSLREGGAGCKKPESSKPERNASGPDDVTRRPPDGPGPDAREERPKWPPYTGELRGKHEVRIDNPNKCAVKVGLRCGSKGRDFTVGAVGKASVYVPAGDYDIFFQYDDDPESLYQGDSFKLAINGLVIRGVEIRLVQVVDGNYGIRKVK